MSSPQPVSLPASVAAFADLEEKSWRKCGGRWKSQDILGVCVNVVMMRLAELREDGYVAGLPNYVSFASSTSHSCSPSSSARS